MVASYVDSVASAGIGSAGSTYPVTMPAGLAAGQIVAVAINLLNSTAWTFEPTAPAGWTAHGRFGEPSGVMYGMAIFSKTATGSEGSSVAFPCQSGSALHASAVSISGANAASLELNALVDASGSATSHAAAVYDANGPGIQVVFGRFQATGGVWSNSTGRISGPNLNQPMVATTPVLAAGSTAPAPVLTYDDPAMSMSVVMGYVELNSPPNAPTLTTLTGGVVVDRNMPHLAAHLFSDPNPGDSQSAFEMRVKLTASPTWTTILVPGPNPFYYFPAGYFTVGDWERQVRTTDAGSDGTALTGPWSGSGFFTVNEPPPGPVITYPVLDQDVEQVEHVDWTITDQDEYQVRRVADLAGVADTGTIYSDTGAVVSTSVRTIPVTFDVNNRTEHVQVRVEDAGLWSPWTSKRVNVSYDSPPAPRFTLALGPALASIEVSITNPAPGAGEEPTAYNDVYIDDGDGEERKASGLPPNTVWTYLTPRSGRDYATAARVVAVASNGATTSST